VSSVVRERSDLSDDHKQLEEYESYVLKEYNNTTTMHPIVGVGEVHCTSSLS